jgi:hypothetical protein
MHQSACTGRRRGAPSPAHRFILSHNRQLPKITGGPFHYVFYAGELVKKAVKMTSKPLHQAVIAPSMMYLLYPIDGEVTEISAYAILAVPQRLNRTVHVPNYCTCRMTLPSETLAR